MAKIISNVLTGVATLSVKQTNDPIAEWSEAYAQAGNYSVRLHKTGIGPDGSTHIQIVPQTGVTFAMFDAAPAGFGFWHWIGAGLAGFYGQYELHFEDPDSDAWIDFTTQTMAGYVGTGAWVHETFIGADVGGYGGVGELGVSFFNWTPPLTAITGAVAAINLAEGAVTDCGPWLLTRVRVELWESAVARTMFVDTVTVNAIGFALEPSTAGLSLGNIFTEVGYTEDGVTVTYTADETDIEVEEETFPIDRVITKETAEVTCNMAESTIVNINKAMAGGVLTGDTLELGGGVNKRINLDIRGTDPDGHTAIISVPLATATGAVGMSYRKGEKTVVPVTFQALKGAGAAITIVYNAG